MSAGACLPLLGGKLASAATVCDISLHGFRALAFLRPLQNHPLMTDREAFSMAVAKWRTLSDAEKEQWRVKPRKGSGAGGGGFQKAKYMQTRGLGEGDADMLSISAVRMPGKPGQEESVSNGVHHERVAALAGTGMF
jgi:hypothetical protein